MKENGFDREASSGTAKSIAFTFILNFNNERHQILFCTLIFEGFYQLEYVGITTGVVVLNHTENIDPGNLVASIESSMCHYTTNQHLGEFTC